MRRLPLIKVLALGLCLVASGARAQWSTRAPMPTPASQAIVVTDLNGKVHVIGGFNSGGIVVNTHQVYDPVANAWSTLASAPFVTRGAAGALGPDGKIYMAGGYVTTYVSSVAAYDVVANSWTVLASLPRAVWEARAAFGADGRFYVVGGENGPTLTQIYNLASNTWSSGAAMPIPRHQHVLLRGADDKLYAIGGLPGAQSSVSVYTPTTNTWAAAPAMPAANASMGAASSPARDRFVLAGGGTSGGNNTGPFFNVTYAFSVASQTWSTLANLPTARRELGAAAVGCTIYALGGSNGVVLSTNEAGGSNFLCPAATPSSTTLTSLTNPSVFGQSVTFQATVTGAFPTGTVTFLDGAAILGTATLNGAGQASFATTGLSVGSHSITAVYAGDPGNLTSTSSPLSQTVNQAATTAAVTSSSNPSIVGGAVTFTATVTASAPGSGTPTGTVTFLDGTSTLGTGTLSAGSATLVTSALGVGLHDLTVVYGGSTNFAPSTSASLGQRVDQDGVSVGLTSSSNPSGYTTNITFTATVASSGPGGTPTGVVTFREGATTLGTGTLSGAGVATFSTSALLGGAHVITADYGGSTNHTPGSATLTQTVTPAGSTSALSSLTNPSVFGQAVTFSVVVTGAGVTPTGTVTFFEGTTALGTATLNGAAQATFSTSALSVATHSLTAVYGGDSNYAASTSPALSQDVQPASSTTALLSSMNPSIIGGSITFTATVTAAAPGSGTPSGTVTFRDGATVLGTPLLDGSGVATISLSSLSTGTHSIAATFEGSASFLTSVSNTVVQVVEQDGVTVLLTSSSNPSTFGVEVTFTATVSSTATGGTPSGTVTFRDGTATLGTATLDSSGVALFATSALQGGARAISAVYGGDPNHTGGSSGTLSQTVTPAATSLLTVASSNPSVFGQAVSFTATIASAAAGTPTGSIVFTDGVTTLGTATVSGPGATFTTSALGVGAHAISATYGGDGNFATSASLALTQTVERANTSTALASSSNPALLGASVTFTATVTASAPGAGAPGGTVTFSDGATTLGTGTLNGAGLASFSTGSLSVGTHVITAAYAGDGSFNPSSSTTLTQAIDTLGVQTTLVAAPSPSSFGASVTLTATVASSSGTPTGTVTFKDGAATTLGTGTLNGSGVATLETSTLSSGTHLLTAEYGGDAMFAAGSSAALAHVVDKAATTTLISSSASPSREGDPVTFTATVASAVAGFTGQVEFFDGTTSLGTAALEGTTATLTTSALAVGDHAISATYQGASDFAASTSPALTQTVEAPGPDLNTKGSGCGCQLTDAGSSSLAALLLAALSMRRRRGPTASRSTDR